MNKDINYRIAFKKIGMTQIHNDGKAIPVTVLKIVPNVVSQLKTLETDGYSAYQIAYISKKEKNISKPLKVKLEKVGLSPIYSHFFEIRVKNDSFVSQDLLSQELNLSDIFAPGTFVDAQGVSKGKGFQGVIKRYNFSGGPAAHGSQFHRRPGSIGNRATPARVYKGKKMPGHLGQETVTVQNLTVVDINTEKGFLLVKGSIPGSKNSTIFLTKAKKKI